VILHEGVIFEKYLKNRLKLSWVYSMMMRRFKECMRWLTLGRVECFPVLPHVGDTEVVWPCLDFSISFEDLEI
jgi:hypothetical protein